MKHLWLPILLAGLILSTAAQARTVYRCVLAGSVSLSTAPEPGSKCTAKELDDRSPLAPNLLGSGAPGAGQIFMRQQDGKTVYGTRALPGSTPVQRFAIAAKPVQVVSTKPGYAAGTADIERYAPLFRSAARKYRIDDAWLRAVAHAESGFEATAVSPKGAQGVMQLMPETAREYAVRDPFSAAESIAAGARHLSGLLRKFDGNRLLASAAYNAGEGNVARYGGIPPFAETREYVTRVEALYALYAAAL